MQREIVNGENARMALKGINANKVVADNKAHF